jgi:hypothetical protein
MEWANQEIVVKTHQIIIDRMPFLTMYQGSSNELIVCLANIIHRKKQKVKVQNPSN